MTTKKWILLTGLIFFVGAALLAFRPIPTPEEKDCVSVQGIVLEINESGTKDVSFKLQGVDKTFYVNRGLERGLNLEKLRTTLANKEVIIKYPNYWTPLDPANSIRHVSKIEFNGEAIFSELN